MSPINLPKEKLIEIARDREPPIRKICRTTQSILQAWLHRTEVAPGQLEVTTELMWRAFGRWVARKDIDDLVKRGWFDKQIIKLFGGRDLKTCVVVLVNRRPEAILHCSAPDVEQRVGLMPHTFRRGAREYLDQDYLGKLSDAELSWLSQFNNEFYNNRVRNTDTDLHQTRTQKRKLWGPSRSRDRCVWSHTRVDGSPNLASPSGQLVSPEAWLEYVNAETHISTASMAEDLMIAAIDAKRAKAPRYEVLEECPFPKKSSKLPTPARPRPRPKGSATTRSQPRQRKST